MTLDMHTIKLKSSLCVFLVIFVVALASDSTSAINFGDEVLDLSGTRSSYQSTESVQSENSDSNGGNPQNDGSIQSNGLSANLSPMVASHSSEPVFDIPPSSLFSSAESEVQLENRLFNNSSSTESSINVRSSNKPSEQTSSSTGHSVLWSSTSGMPNFNKSEENSTHSSGSLNITSSLEDKEGVVLATEQPIPYTKAIFQQTLVWLNDTYTLSILIPVAAGFVFASVIIVTIATCKCIKRRCYRRNLRRKVLPETVKNMRPSDRARLLAETSDDEF